MNDLDPIRAEALRQTTEWVRQKATYGDVPTPEEIVTAAKTFEEFLRG